MKLVLKDSRRYVLRFDKGEELFSSLIQFCESEQIEAAPFTAIGASDGVTLSFYHGHERKYSDKAIDDELEIISLNGLVGNIDGKTMIHAHGSFSDRNMALRGGHVKELIVGSTCEVFLIKLEGKIIREFDPETGLNLMK